MAYRSFVHFCKEKFLRRLEIRDKGVAGRGQTGWQAATPTATLTISPHLIRMKKKLSSLKSKAVTGRTEPYCQSVLPAGAYKQGPGQCPRSWLCCCYCLIFCDRVCVAQDGFSKQPKITLKFRFSCLYFLRVGLQARVNILALKRFIFLFNWEQT